MKGIGNGCVGVAQPPFICIVTKQTEAGWDFFTIFMLLFLLLGAISGEGLFSFK